MVQFDQHCCKFINRPPFRRRGSGGAANRKNDMYKLALSLAFYSTNRAMMAVRPVELNELWHQRLGHVAHRSIQQLKERHMVTGLDGYAGRADGEHPFCEACTEGKQHAAPISKLGVASRGAAPLDLVQVTSKFVSKVN